MLLFIFKYKFVYFFGFFVGEGRYVNKIGNFFLGVINYWRRGKSVGIRGDREMNLK